MNRQTNLVARAGLAVVMVVGLLLPALGSAPAAAEQAASSSYRVAGASLAAGGENSCVILGTGQVRCWGHNVWGQLGLGHTDYIGDGEHPDSVPVVNLGSGRTARAIATGNHHTCVVLDTGQVRCWGRNTDGQLGLGHVQEIGDNEHPAAAPVVSLGRKARAITAGEQHTCAILDNGQVRCWGYNVAGQLGLGHTQRVGDDEHPGSVPVVNLGAGRTATAITAGEDHTCAILDNGRVRCWGDNNHGQLGLGHTTNVGDSQLPSSAPMVNLGAGRRAVGLSAGGHVSCAVLDNRQLRCWGKNQDGQLGLGHVNDIGDNEQPASVPVVNLGPGRGAHAVSAGGDHTCAVLDTRQVRCWGNNHDGQLGLGHTTYIGDNEPPASQPVVRLGSGRAAVAIAVGTYHSCAVLDTRQVRCWGWNDAGPLGLGHTQAIGDNEHPDSQPPARVGGPVRTRAATTVAVKAKPKRDRVAPYRFRIRGSVKGAFIADAATCTGKVKVVVRKATKPRKNKRVGKASSRLRLQGGRCQVLVKVSTKARFPGKLKAVVRYRGSANLAPSRRTVRLRAG